MKRVLAFAVVLGALSLVLPPAEAQFRRKIPEQGRDNTLAPAPAPQKAPTTTAPLRRTAPAPQKAPATQAPVQPKPLTSPVPLRRTAPAPQVSAPPTAPAATVFTSRETTVIRDYFRTAPPPPPPPEPPAPGRKKKIPPGLRKKVERGGELPPGWQKKIARGEVMDADVYAHSAPLPPDLAKQLPPQPKGTAIVTVEGKAVRILEKTRRILDVFDVR